MSKKGDEIEQKLAELEFALREEELSDKLPARQADSRSTAVTTSSIDSVSVTTEVDLQKDLYVLGGICLIALGVLMFLMHIRVGSGVVHWLGFGTEGGGYGFLPLIIGIGILFYDYKSKLGWILLAMGAALIIFLVLSQLVVTFPHVTALGFIVMFVPVCAGIALLMKGVKGQRSITKTND